MSYANRLLWEFTPRPIVRFLPVKAQAWYWAQWGLWKYGRTSHFRIEAIRQLRRSARLPLKDAAAMIAAYYDAP